MITLINTKDFLTTCFEQAAAFFHI